MELKKKSFILHVDSLGVLSDLSDEQAGRLFKAMLAFHKGEELDLDPLTKMAFSFFKNQFIRDNEKYIKTCEARAQAGSKGGKQKQQNIANASKSYQKVAKVAENDSDSKSDSKSVSKNKIKDLFDADRIIPVWNSLGCARHKGLTKSAEKALEKTYKEYCKSAKEPKELNDWLESYLKKGFKNWMTDHHRDLDNGQWCADLEFAVRFSTYDKIKNTVKK